MYLHTWSNRTKAAERRIKCLTLYAWLARGFVLGHLNPQQLCGLAKVLPPVCRHCPPPRRHSGAFVRPLIHFDSVIVQSRYANTPCLTPTFSAEVTNTQLKCNTYTWFDASASFCLLRNNWASVSLTRIEGHVFMFTNSCETFFHFPFLFALLVSKDQTLW